MKNVSIYSNGKPVLGEKRIQDVLTASVGVFETMRVYGRKVFRLQEHLERLKHSAKTTGFGLLPSNVILKRAVGQTLKAHLKNHPKSEQLVLRLAFFDKTPFVFIFERKHKPALYLKGVSLRTSPVRRSLSNASSPEAKSAAYQNGLMAQLEPKLKETYEWLFLDQNSYVNEVTVGNIFIVTPSRARSPSFTLKTPPTAGILNGVTRQFVIECALQAGIRAEERMLTRHEIYNASEAFLTNTSWEILPIRELDGRKIGQVPGKVTTRLQRLFQKRIKEECF